MMCLYPFDHIGAKAGEHNQSFGWGDVGIGGLDGVGGRE